VTRITSGFDAIASRSSWARTKAVLRWQELAEKLTAMSIPETQRNIANKILSAVRLRADASEE
jgi:hypothetical protein